MDLEQNARNSDSLKPRLEEIKPVGYYVQPGKVIAGGSGDDIICDNDGTAPVPKPPEP